MARSTPYLQRRGHTFSFRIDVPRSLRPIVGSREFTRTLQTESRSVAEPIALALGGITKRLFIELRLVMNDKEKMLSMLAEARRKITMLTLRENLEEREFDTAGDVLRNAQVHHNLQVRALESEIARLKTDLQNAPITSLRAPDSASAPLPELSSSILTLKDVVEQFLADPSIQKKEQMLKKHRTALGLLLDVIGRARPIDSLKKKDLKDFFGVVCSLPPRWKDVCRARGISALTLAKESHDVTIAPKTFKDGYLASISGFLEVAIRDWEDQGFPATLSTKGIVYTGKVEEGLNKQRAFTRVELERLFYGPELRTFKADAALEHQFWLPAIGLLTGARLNEISQMNPQVDISQELDSGIWFFHLTDASDSDEGVKKSTKTKGSRRKVPIHKWLIELGFLAYVDRIKKDGAKRLFPVWAPAQERAGVNPGDWFVAFLAEIGLRDVTPGARIAGLHAFRSTLMASAANSAKPVDSSPLTGHVEPTDGKRAKSKVVRGYEGELNLKNKHRILHEIEFEIDLSSSKFFASKALA